MIALQPIIIAILLPLALATQPVCLDFSLPVQVSTAITKFTVSPLHNNSESTSFLVNSVARTANVQNLVAGEVNITRAYNTNFRYCQPNQGVSQNGIVQVLTHGFGFDKS